MLKKALYLGLFIFSVNVVLSTVSCKSKTKTTSYCRSIGTTSLTAYRENNSALSDGDNEIVATTLRLQLNVLSNTEVCLNAPLNSDLSFFNKAYAVVAPGTPSQYARLDSIVGFDIVSDKDYDGTHPAGTSLKGSIFSTDDEYILRLLAADNCRFNFYCDKAPAEVGTHSFTVKLIKNNGDVITVNSIPIKLLK